MGEPTLEPDQGEDGYPKVESAVEVVPDAKEHLLIDEPPLDPQFPECSQNVPRLRSMSMILSAFRYAWSGSTAAEPNRFRMIV